MRWDHRSEPGSVAAATYFKTLSFYSLHADRKAAAGVLAQHCLGLLYRYPDDTTGISPFAVVPYMPLAFRSALAVRCLAQAEDMTVDENGSIEFKK